MDANSQLQADLDELSAAIDIWVAGLAELQDRLLALREQLGSASFEQHMLMVAGLDHETLDDFLSFDGTLSSVTDRMIGAFERVVSALN